MRHLISINQPSQDIFKLWSSLHLEGWNTDDQNLPTGWRRKTISSKPKFLSPMMDVISSTDHLKKHIVKTQNEYSNEDVAKVMRLN